MWESALPFHKCILIFKISQLVPTFIFITALNWYTVCNIFFILLLKISNAPYKFLTLISNLHSSYYYYYYCTVGIINQFSHPSYITQQISIQECSTVQLYRPKVITPPLPRLASDAPVWCTDRQPDTWVRYGTVFGWGLVLLPQVHSSPRTTLIPHISI